MSSQLAQRVTTAQASAVGHHGIGNVNGVSVETSQSRRVTSDTRRSRKISWDIVRSACVILVMLYHATFLSHAVHPELQPRVFVFPYQVGASLLLVLSAYFACVTIGRGSLLRYWWNRIARLLPPFLGAVLVIYAATILFAPRKGWFIPTPEDLLANLFMLWNWQPAKFWFIDGSHWTVPIQLLGFSFAAVLYKSRWGHGTHLLRVLWTAILVPLAQWPLRLFLAPDWYRSIVDGIGMHRWHLFVAGVAIWLWSNRRITAVQFSLLLGSCMVAHFMHNYTQFPEGIFVDWPSAIAVSIGMLVLTATASGPDWNRFVPSWAYGPIQWFAGISYGVFLMHQTMGYLVSSRLQDIGAGPGLQTIAMLLNGVLLGWMLTRTIEQPVHRFLMDSFDHLHARSASRQATISEPTHPLTRV